MYRIELSPGEETVFRSIEELAVAVKRGVITPRARIFHNASNKWLPIQFHPHYKAAVSMPLTQAALVAGPQVKPLSTLNLPSPVEPEAPMPLPFPAPTPIAPVPPSARKSHQQRPAKENGSRRRSKPRRQLRIALVGALLIGGAQWVLSATLFSRTNAPQLIEAKRHLIAVPVTAMKRVSSTNTAAMIPVLPPSAAPKAPAVLHGGTGPHAQVSAPSFGGSSAGESAATAPEVERPPANIQIAAPPATSAPVLDPPVDSAKKNPQRIKR